MITALCISFHMASLLLLFIINFVFLFRSHLFIDGKQLVNNGGLHGAQQICGAIVLAAGGHNVKVIFVPTVLLYSYDNHMTRDRSLGSKLEVLKA